LSGPAPVIGRTWRVLDARLDDRTTPAARRTQHPVEGRFRRAGRLSYDAPPPDLAGGRRIARRAHGDPVLYGRAVESRAL